MAYADVSLQSTDVAKTSTGPVSLGGTRGGGMNFSFGGINDSPMSKTVWIVLGAVVVGIAALLWWTSRKKGSGT